MIYYVVKGMYREIVSFPPPSVIIGRDAFRLLARLNPGFDDRFNRKEATARRKMTRRSDFEGGVPRVFRKSFLSTIMISNEGRSVETHAISKFLIFLYIYISFSTI